MIQHLKNDQLDYICSGVYPQNCKANGSPTLLSTSYLYVEVGIAKYLNMTLTFDPYDLISKLYPKIEFYFETYAQYDL